MLRWVWLTLSLALTPIVSAHSAGLIRFDSPVVVDTAAHFSPSDQFGRVLPHFPQGGLYFQSSESQALLCNLSSLPYYWSGWTAGADTNEFAPEPQSISGERPDGSVPLFTPFALSWNSPYLYVAGALYEGGGKYTAVRRFDAELHAVDETPVAIAALPPNDVWLAEDSILWLLRRTSQFLKVASYNLEAGNQILSDSQIPSSSFQRERWTYVSATDLITTHYRTDGALEASSLTRDGTLASLGVLPGLADSINMFAWPRLFPVGADTVLCCFIDSSDAGEPALGVASFGRGDSVPDISFRRCVAAGETFPEKYGRYALARRGDTLWALSYYTPQRDIHYLRFNWRTGAFLDDGFFAGIPNPIYLAFIDVSLDGEVGRYFYTLNGEIRALEFSLSDPSADYRTTSLCAIAETFRRPTLVERGDGLTLAVQQADGSSLSVLGYQIADSDALTPSPPVTWITPEGKPFAPTLYADDSLTALIWSEDVTDYNPVLNADTTFDIKVASWSGATPEPAIIAAAAHLEYAPRSYDYRPSFARAGEEILFDVLRWDFEDYWETPLRVRAHALNGATGAVNPSSIPFSTNGEMALIPSGDSVLAYGSWYFCAAQDNVACQHFVGGHHRSVIKNFTSSGGGSLTYSPWLIPFIFPNDIGSWCDERGAVLTTIVPPQFF
ncbi:MAG TPA: hypothetical protein VLB27_08700 [candidate division Zixibacteria bacterium]|nr:hypothetical protein [candidate division Zixibacteria bacterium]